MCAVMDSGCGVLWSDGVDVLSGKVTSDSRKDNSVYVCMCVCVSASMYEYEHL